jgi:hypothetical protein
MKNSNNIDLIEKIINEHSVEQSRLNELLKISMNKFASERSFETCLDALNISIQLTSVRGKLMESYEHYSRILEGEILKLRKNQGSNTR